MILNANYYLKSALMCLLSGIMLYTRASPSKLKATTNNVSLTDMSVVGHVATSHHWE